MKPFMNADFLLTTATARHLYHDIATKMPIIDYHCHIDPREIAEDRKFDNISEVWLGGDHYKWRQMRWGYHYQRMAPFYQGIEGMEQALDVVEVKTDRKSTRLNSSHVKRSRMPSSA